MDFLPRASLGMSLLREGILRMKHPFRMEFSSLAAAGAVKPTLQCWSVIAAAGAEQLGVLCCTRFAAVTTHSNHKVHYVCPRYLGF